jgi:predicted permease
VLWAAAGMLLLIGCVNIASLLLARAVERSRETATRLALGAGRATILQQLLAESLLLGAAGGIGGVLLGFWALQGVKPLAHGSLELWQEVTLDTRVLAWSIGASLLASCIFGVLPALQVSRVDIRSTLGEGGRGNTGNGHRWARRLLVVAEVALSVVLLVCAGLFLRTFSALRALQPGFEVQGVMTAQLSLQDARYATSGQVNRLFTETLARMRELPGTEGAAVGLGLPYERQLRMGFQFMDGAEAAGPGGNTTATYVTPDYFAVLRIPLLRGRALGESDGPDGLKVVAVNQAFASRYFPEGEPIGRHIQLAGATREIVGVVGDVLQQSGGDKGPLAALPATFFPAAQASDEMLQLVHTWFSPSWIVRTAETPAQAAAGIQSAIETVDPRLPIASFRGMDEVQRRATARQRFQAVLLAMLAGPASLLAALGIYGLIAHLVAERRREVGIRLALGATRWQTVRSAAQPGILLALVGTLVGCLLARLAVKSLQHLIWGVRATDPGTFAAVVLGLLLVAAAASLLPALRLNRLDPAETLRDS